MRKLQEFDMRPQDVVLDRVLTTLEHHFLATRSQDSDTALMPTRAVEEVAEQELSLAPDFVSEAETVKPPESPLAGSPQKTTLVSVLAGFLSGWLIWYWINHMLFR